MPRNRKLSQVDLTLIELNLFDRLIQQSDSLEDVIADYHAIFFQKEEAKILILRAYLDDLAEKFPSTSEDSQDLPQHEIETLRQLILSLDSLDAITTIEDEFLQLFPYSKKQEEIFSAHKNSLTQKKIQRQYLPCNTVCFPQFRLLTSLPSSFDLVGTIFSTEVMQKHFASKISKAHSHEISFANRNITKNKQKALQNLFEHILDGNSTTTEIMVFFFHILDRNIVQKLVFDPENFQQLEGLFYENKEKITAILTRENGIQDLNDNLEFALKDNILKVRDQIQMAVFVSSFEEKKDQILAHIFYKQIAAPLRDEFGYDDNKLFTHLELSRSFVSLDALIVETQKIFRDNQEYFKEFTAENGNKKIHPAVSAYVILHDLVINNNLKEMLAWQDLEKKAFVYPSTAINLMQPVAARLDDDKQQSRHLK